LVIVGAAERYREILHRLKGEEHHRALLVAELEHRVKNKLTVVYAILSRELRDHPEVWQKVRGRLSTLTTADEFIARSGGAGAHLKSLVAMEFAPYGSSRVRINSKDVFVPAKTATVLALMFHELVTNAAKYGALSVPEGRINVDWRVFRGEVTIDWAESGGPPVQTPQRKGFGTSLLERGLEESGGRAAVYYERSGLVCRLTFVLPAENSELPHQLANPVLRGGPVAA
jgi:two-component sensor histidine kinase